MNFSVEPLYKSGETLPEEEGLSREAAAGLEYERLLRRISEQSVTKHFDAYADIAWNAPEFAIDPRDPRWGLPPDDPLGGTTWYRAQTQEVRSGIGLHLTASFLRIGLQFESVLKRGLLEFADRLPNGALEFRYVYHEVIEEAQHSLMFQEFVNRSGFNPGGLPAVARRGSRFVIWFGARFPELFFIFVLGGEDPIDYVQRTALRDRDAIHPLLRRITQIHITEEARHLAFARQYLRRFVPQLSAFHRLRLAIWAPTILGRMARMMMRPSAQVARRWQIPESTLAEAYRGNPVTRRRQLAATEKVRSLCVELGIVTPWSRLLWSAWGLWPSQAEAAEFGFRIA